MADIEVVTEYFSESEQFRSDLASMRAEIEGTAADINRTSADVKVGLDTTGAFTALENFVRSLEARGITLRVAVATPPAFAQPPSPPPAPAVPPSRPQAFPIQAVHPTTAPPPPAVTPLATAPATAVVAPPVPARTPLPVAEVVRTPAVIATPETPAPIEAAHAPALPTPVASSPPATLPAPREIEPPVSRAPLPSLPPEPQAEKPAPAPIALPAVAEPSPPREAIPVPIREAPPAATPAEAVRPVALEPPAAVAPAEPVATPAPRPLPAAREPAIVPDLTAPLPPAQADNRAPAATTATVTVVADTSRAESQIESLTAVPPVVVPVATEPAHAPAPNAEREPFAPVAKTPEVSPAELIAPLPRTKRNREAHDALAMMQRNLSDAVGRGDEEATARLTNQITPLWRELKGPAEPAEPPPRPVPPAGHRPPPEETEFPAPAVPPVRPASSTASPSRAVEALENLTDATERRKAEKPEEPTRIPAASSSAHAPVTEEAAREQGAMAGAEKQLASLFGTLRQQIEKLGETVKAVTSDVAKAGGGGAKPPGGPSAALPPGGGESERLPRAPGSLRPNYSGLPSEVGSRFSEDDEDESGTGRGSGKRSRPLIRAGRLGRYLTAGFAAGEVVTALGAYRQYNTASLEAGGQPEGQAQAELGLFNRFGGANALVDPFGEKEFLVKDTIRQAGADERRAEGRRDLSQEIGHAQRANVIAATGGVEQDRLAAADRRKQEEEELQKERTAKGQIIGGDFQKNRAAENLKSDRELRTFIPYVTELAPEEIAHNEAVETRRVANQKAIDARQRFEQNKLDADLKAKSEAADQEKAIADRNAEAAERQRQTVAGVRVSATEASGAETRLRLEGKPVEAQKAEFQRQLEDEDKILKAKGQAEFDTGNRTEAQRTKEELEARQAVRPDILAQNAAQLAAQERLKDIASRHEIEQTKGSADEELRRAQGDIGGAAQATLERENADRVKRLNEEAEALKNVNAKESDRISKLSEAEKAAGATRQQALTTAQTVRRQEAVTDIGVATTVARLRARGQGVAARELEADEPFKERIREVGKDATRQKEADALEQERQAAAQERQAERHEGATRVRAQARETQLRTDRKPFSADLAALDERNRERLREAGGDAEGTAAAQELHRQELREFLKPKPEGGGQGSFLDRANALQASVFQAFGTDHVKARHDAQQELINTNKRYGRDADHLLSSEKAGGQGGWGPQSNAGETGKSLAQSAKDLQEAVARLNDFTQYFGAVGIA